MPRLRSGCSRWCLLLRRSSPRDPASPGSATRLRRAARIRRESSEAAPPMGATGCNRRGAVRSVRIANRTASSLGSGPRPERPDAQFLPRAKPRRLQPECRRALVSAPLMHRLLLPAWAQPSSAVKLGAPSNAYGAGVTRSLGPGEKNRFAFLKSAAKRLDWTVKRNMQTARSARCWSTETLRFQERGCQRQSRSDARGRRCPLRVLWHRVAQSALGHPDPSLSQRGWGKLPAGRARPQDQVSTLREFASVQIIKRCATRKNWSPGLRMGSAPYVAANRCEGARWSGGPER
jgi:hypothetical protein